MTVWPNSSLLIVLLDLSVQSVASSIFLFFLPGHLSLVGKPTPLPLLRTPLLLSMTLSLLLPQSTADCSLRSTCLTSLFQFHHDELPFPCSSPSFFMNFISPFCHHLPLPMHSLWSLSVQPLLFAPFSSSFSLVTFPSLPFS